MAAVDGLSCYYQHLESPQSGPVRIICELHEDWVVQIGTGAQLVSAKHREPSSGAWPTIKALVEDGGLGHLFARWLHLKRTPTVRLVTSAATATGDPSDLARCPDLLKLQTSGEELAEDETTTLRHCIDQTARSLMMYRKGLPSSWQAADGARAKNLIPGEDLLDAVTAFVKVLVIDQARPTRDLIAHAAPTLYARPITAKMGHPDHLASAVWEAVLQLFRLRMRDRGPSLRGGLSPVIARPENETRSASDSALETRVVTLDDVVLAVNIALSHPVAYLPPQPSPRTTKLGIKMSVGDCSDTSIERAERLRLDYVRYRRERGKSVPGSSAEQRQIERKLHRIADEETEQARVSTGNWGGDLWLSLSRRLEDPSADMMDAGLDGDLMLGGICDLASRCQVWFSPRFDVDSVASHATSAARSPKK